MFKITLNGVGQSPPITAVWYIGRPYPVEMDAATSLVIVVVDGPEIELVRRSLRWYAGLYNPRATVGDVDVLIKQLQRAIEELREKVEKRNE